MDITLKKKAEEIDDLPPEGEKVEGADVEEISEKERLRKLELDNAEMRGRLSALQEKKPTAVDQFQQTKLRVLTDINQMDDEQFEKLYKMQKHQASMAVMEQENAATKAESRRAVAEAEAKTELGIKYGTSFYEMKSQIEEALEDLSPEVRQDPKKLARYMERQYLALATQVKPKKATEKEEPRRRITPDFEQPNPVAIEKVKKSEDDEEITEVDRPLAKAMGLKTEKERKEYMTDFVPMNLGGGVVFRDPEKGFERVEPKAG